jgi:hypothetical protein
MKIKMTKVVAGDYDITLDGAAVGKVVLTGRPGVDNYPWEWWIDTAAVPLEGRPQGTTDTKGAAVDKVTHLIEQHVAAGLKPDPAPEVEPPKVKPFADVHLSVTLTRVEYHRLSWLLLEAQAAYYAKYEGEVPLAEWDDPLIFEGAVVAEVERLVENVLRAGRAVEETSRDR